MGPVGLLVLYVLLALGFSFLCSILEAVLLSVTPSYVAALEQEGHAVAERLGQYKENIDRPLAAILSLNTIAHTVGATGAGAQAAKVFGEGELAVAIISGALTLLILVVSEIIPKTLGAVYWRLLAPVITPVLTGIIWTMWPLVKLSQGITYLVARGEEDEASVSREEFTAMAELGEEEGVFEEEESRILKNLFRFSSLRVKDIMTPRTVIKAMPEEQTVAEVVDNHEEFRFSRIPVFTENPDDITGYILKDEILLKAAQEEDALSLHDLKREIQGMPETLPLPEAFEQLVDSYEHIALVVDEYGGTAGIVTMEDIVETLLGMEIVDEADSAEDMQKLAREQWMKRAARLGLIPEDRDDVPEDLREAVSRFGTTGGEAPDAASRTDTPLRSPQDERPFTREQVASALTDEERRMVEDEGAALTSESAGEEIPASSTRPPASDGVADERAAPGTGAADDETDRKPPEEAISEDSS
ncbi:MAG: hemolysin [Bacteroidetes bacterium QS_8_68_15]|nr:MAG: hemolysin [Bacteroidetes bacterium QS_8_68_15]